MRLRCPDKTQTLAAFVASGIIGLLAGQLSVTPVSTPAIIALHLVGVAASAYALVGLVKMIRELF